MKQYQLLLILVFPRITFILISYSLRSWDEKQLKLRVKTRVKNKQQTKYAQ